MSKTRFQIRKEREAKWHGQYSRAESCEDGCAYCGQIGNLGEDHVPPLAVLEKVGKLRNLFLYDACVVCNARLGDYPSACLVVRAEYLVCVLRRDWLLTTKGVKRQFSTHQVASAGVGIKARLQSGQIKARCRCRSCTDLVPSLSLKGPKLPYAGKDETRGGDRTIYDDGGMTGV